jgi:hypothetical protein
MSDNPPPIADTLEPPSGRLEPDAPRLQATFSVLARVEDHIRFADAKAGFVATLHAFLIGPLAGNIGGLRSVVATFHAAAHALLAAVIGVYGVLFLISMGLVALTVLPRSRRSGRRPSKLFFGRIAREYGRDPDRFIAELGALSDHDWQAELGQYIVDASAIAATKHRLARWAIIFTVPTVLSWMLMVLVLMYAGHVGGP